jgi:hypothetical protein
MKQQWWPLSVMALVLGGLGPSSMAQAPSGFTGPPAIPRPFSQFLSPGVGRMISTVDNFTGIVAAAVIQGTGKDNQGNPFEFELDVRAMQGIFSDRDGAHHRGTFAFT